MPDDINQQNTTSTDNNANQPVVDNPQTPPVEEKVEETTNEPSNDSENPTEQTSQTETPASKEGNDLFNKPIDELMGLNLSDEEKKSFYENVEKAILNRVFIRIMDALENKEDQDKFTSLTESGDETQVNEFLKSKNIDMKAISAEETLIYKVEMKENAKDVDKLINQYQKTDQSADQSNSEAPTTAIV